MCGLRPCIAGQALALVAFKTVLINDKGVGVGEIIDLELDPIFRVHFKAGIVT